MSSASGLTSPSILDGKVPVFVFPVQLDFYFEDQTTHKRVVTIYNPYEFDVTFKASTLILTFLLTLVWLKPVLQMSLYLINATHLTVLSNDS